MKFNKSKIEQAITLAEQQTSGEIRVHVTAYHKGSIIEQAKEKFESLGMTQTKERNAILFYVAKLSKEFCVLGDQGIHDKVTQGFWDEIVGPLGDNFKKKQFTEGLCESIELCGQKLKQYFPIAKDDKNELPNTVTTD